MMHKRTPHALLASNPLLPRLGAGIFSSALALALAACGGTSFEGTGGAGGSTSATTNSTTTTTGAGGDTTATGTGGGSTTSTTTTTTGAGGSNACALADDTTPTAEVNAAGCHVLDRDTSACADARTAQGLTGFWLHFSCRVLLTSTTEGGKPVVKAEADGQPDYASNYFSSSDPCHEAYPGGMQNPNQIVAKTRVIALPLSSDMSSQKMMSAIVGVALNGVPIFGDFAAPGDDIYKEAKTFDRCAGHPQMSGTYHYHSEPAALSNDDDRFIGVMRDGYPIYGRKDQDGSYPASLDQAGGHSGVTADSGGAAVYHYHVNEQTSTNPGTAGQKQWFITTGTYRGTPATCAACN